MIQAKRILVAVALAAGATSLAAPAASAISVSGELDNLATTGIGPEYRDAVPSVSGQLDQVHQINQLHQVTDQAAPVVGLLGALG